MVSQLRNDEIVQNPKWKGRGFKGTRLCLKVLYNFNSVSLFIFCWHARWLFRYLNECSIFSWLHYYLISVPCSLSMKMSRVIKPWVVTPIKHKSLLKGSSTLSKGSREKKTNCGDHHYHCVAKVDHYINLDTPFYVSHSFLRRRWFNFSCSLSTRENSH